MIFPWALPPSGAVPWADLVVLLQEEEAEPRCLWPLASGAADSTATSAGGSGYCAAFPTRAVWLGGIEAVSTCVWGAAGCGWSGVGTGWGVFTVVAKERVRLRRFSRREALPVGRCSRAGALAAGVAGLWQGAGAEGSRRVRTLGVRLRVRSRVWSFLESECDIAAPDGSFCASPQRKHLCGVSSVWVRWSPLRTDPESAAGRTLPW